MNPTEYSILHKQLSDYVERQGFRLYNKNLFWHKDSSFLDVFRQFNPGATRIPDRKYQLFSMARAVSYLAGDTVECGVLEGASSFLICHANLGKPGDFYHHVFDSFQGLSEAGKYDKPTTEEARIWSAGELAVPLETVQANLSRFNFVKYYKGWIPDRFAEVADRKFSLVHIDVDFYQPTLDALTFFYERTVPGGFIICDDYGFNNCAGSKKAFDEFLDTKPEQHVISLTTGQGFIVKF